MNGASNERRLQRLLDAVVSVASDLALPQVLQRIVQSARELVDAKYAALGVVGSDRTLAEFHYTGMSEAERQKIGDLPTGKGVLGQLIERPVPLRLRHISDHPQSSGFPANHPPMQGFLGVPIRVGDDVFGNLYLTEPIGREEFSAEDESVIEALAAAAGIAIDNARLYDETHHRERSLGASIEILTAMLEGASPSETLELIAERARVVGDAAHTLIALGSESYPTGSGVPTGEEQVLTLEVAAGLDAEVLRGRPVSLENTLVGDVFRRGEPVVQAVDPLDQHSLTGGGVPINAPNGSILLVPLRVGEHTLGVLAVTRESGQAPFDGAHLQTMTAFARHTAVALEYARAQEQREQLAVYEDRDRIARDLHDQVIQRMFGIALGLQGMTRQIVRQDLIDRVQGYVKDIDLTIQEIRRTIFFLQEEHSERRSLRGQLLDVAQVAAESLGFEPRIVLDGPLDSAVPDGLRIDLLSTLREALANVARHAAASSVHILVRADVPGRLLLLRVEDDGVGLPLGGVDRDPLAGRGLSNLAVRAEALGGTCGVSTDAQGGTTLEWSIPIGF